MNYPSVFSSGTTENLIVRISKLQPTSQPSWGKMNVAQMLAHLCVPYEMVYENKHQRPGAFARFLLKLIVKPSVVGDKPYRKNTRTAPAFLIVDQRDFEFEKARLISYLRRVKEDGESFFDQRESFSFGPMSIHEWNAMFYKHLDYHLNQFNV